MAVQFQWANACNPSRYPASQERRCLAWHLSTFMAVACPQDHLRITFELMDTHNDGTIAEEHLIEILKVRLSGNRPMSRSDSALLRTCSSRCIEGGAFVANELPLGHTISCELPTFSLQS